MCVCVCVIDIYFGGVDGGNGGRSRAQGSRSACISWPVGGFGWMDGTMDGWMDGWMDGRLTERLLLLCSLVDRTAMSHPSRSPSVTGSISSGRHHPLSVIVSSHFASTPPGTARRPQKYIKKQPPRILPRPSPVFICVCVCECVRCFIFTWPVSWSR